MGSITMENSNLIESIKRITASVLNIRLYGDYQGAEDTLSG